MTRIGKDCFDSPPCVRRLVLYFGTTPEFWLNLQTDYDLRLVRRGKLKAITKQVKPLPRAA